MLGTLVKPLTSNLTVNISRSCGSNSLYPHLVAYPAPNHQFKLAAGWLLDQAGWKGKLVEGIAMHNKQALVLTNPSSCTSQQILCFAEKVKASIEQKFSVSLEIEPRVYVST